jgi:hypothetical protein
LAIRYGASQKEVKAQDQQKSDCQGRYDDAYPLHYTLISYRTKKFATKFAITCGNRIETATTTAEAHRRIALRIPGRDLHRFACQR